MAFCEKCGASLDPSASFCTSCGAKVASAAAAAPVVEPAPQPTYQQPAPEPQPVYQQTAYQQPAPQCPLLRNALLDVWKTNAGMTVLGIIAIMIIAGIFSSFGETAALVASLIISLVSGAYAILYYPTFFSENPKLTDPKIVSLLNGMFGGIIFGCLWNASLTNRKKGVSYIVFLVFAGLAVISGITSLIALA